MKTPQLDGFWTRGSPHSNGTRRAFNFRGKTKNDYRHHHQTFFKNTLKKLNSRTLKNPFIDEDDDEVIQLT